MAIAKNPQKAAKSKDQHDIAATKFIEKTTVAGRPKKSVMIRIPLDLLPIIDAAARRLGVNRTAFMVMSAAEKAERMENARSL